MYIVMIILLLFVLPVGSILADVADAHNALALPFLIGKWFVFWAVGVRLFLAGLRQIIQPQFTAQTIFGIKDDASLPIVRELGFANVASGFLGIVTIFYPGFLFASAIVGAIFYGLAGVQHMTVKGRNTHETVAMVSDVFIFIVLVFVVFANAMWIFI